MTARFASLLVAAGFVLFLCLPGGLSLLEPPKSAAPAAKAASDSLLARAGRLEAAFNEAWSPRPDLIRLNNALRHALFGESAMKNVVQGKGRWLYYAGEWNLEDFECVMPLTEKELRGMAEILEERRAWLERRGIRFLVVVCPNKETIYPEHLPTRFRRLGERSRLDQVAERLDRETKIELLDLRGPLLAAKERGRVYHYTDTHWNDLGAFVGAQAVTERLRVWFPAVPPMDLADYEVVERDEPGWDLSRQLMLEDRLREDAVILTPRFAPAAKPASRDYPDPVTLPGRQTIYRSTGNPSLPKAVVFRDSFSSALHPFLSERFGEVAWIWDHRFLADIVEREKPDVVIYEVVERYLFALSKPNPPELTAEATPKVATTAAP